MPHMDTLLEGVQAHPVEARTGVRWQQNPLTDSTCPCIILLVDDRACEATTLVARWRYPTPRREPISLATSPLLVAVICVSSCGMPDAPPVGHPTKGGGMVLGYATEIIVHQVKQSDIIGISFVGDGKVFTHHVEYEGGSMSDVLESACDLANNFEEATGIPWRLHDESKGRFEAVYGE